MIIIGTRISGVFIYSRTINTGRNLGDRILAGRIIFQ